MLPTTLPGLVLLYSPSYRSLAPAYPFVQDEIVIGRHRLYFLELPVVSGVRFSHLADSETT